MGEVTIPWDAVVSIKSDRPLVVVVAGGRTLVGKVQVNITDKTLEVVTVNATESVPLSDLVAIRDDETERAHRRQQNPGFLDLWKGFVDVGWSAARGNAQTGTFTTALNATRVTSTDKTAGYFNTLSASALTNGESQRTAAAIRGGWSYNRNISERLFVTVFNDYEHDRFQDLDLRFVAGGGVGYQTFKDERKRLDLLGGFSYNRESFSTPLTRNSGEGFWGDDFTYKLSSVMELSQQFRMFHNLSDPGAYRMNFDLSTVTTLNSWLSWQLSISDRFLSNPVPGLQRNDVLYTTGLRVSFAH